MLQRLHVRNFTVFGEADFEFGPGLNVVVGTNGTGKSHVLKLGYAVLSNLDTQLRDERKRNESEEKIRVAGKPLTDLNKYESTTLESELVSYSGSQVGAHGVAGKPHPRPLSPGEGS
ncbi:MAG: AAA family ATPase [Hymenobacter sp.]|nr:AAA family ATPase [Hymenobacter sp.]